MPEPDLGLLLTEVASRLRAGAPTDVAWATALRRAGLPTTADGGTPVDPGVPPPLAELVHRRARDPAVRASLRAVVAACRLTHEVGAPLAQVLDRCAQSITEAREAHDARRVAMAAPAATARILAILPVIGLLLGMVLGADPVAVAFDGRWGSLSTTLGLLLALAGRWWSSALVTAARSPAGASARRPRGGDSAAADVGGGGTRSSGWVSQRWEDRSGPLGGPRALPRRGRR